MLKKFVILALILASFTLGGYISHSSLLIPRGDISSDAAPAISTQSIEEIQTQQGKPVQVMPVTQQDLAITQTFYGTVAPHAEANVQGKHGGAIVFLKAEEGDSVKRGETVVRLDDSDAQLQLQQAIAGQNTALQGVKQAESNYAMIQKTVSRYEELFKEGFIPRQNLDEMQNQLLVAQAGLDSAREQVKSTEAQISLLKNTLTNLSITAPISGIIDQKKFNLNEIPKAGDVIYHIVDLDSVYVEVEIPESYISQMKEQTTVETLFDSLPDQVFTGTIERIIPTGNPQSRTFIAKVLVQNPAHAAKPGMFARVNIAIEQLAGALILDKKALIKDGEQYYVFKIVDQRAEKVAVDVKHRSSDRVAVLSDHLFPQDHIVVEGARMLQPHDLVNVR